MSEINCYCDEYHYGEIFPNISLVILKNIKSGYIAENEVEIAENSIGFTINNDPFIIINNKPINNKYFYLSDDEINSLKQDDFTELLYINDLQNSWNEFFKGGAINMWILVDSVKKSGYIEGNLGAWINQKVAEFLEKTEVLEIYKKI